MSADLRGKKIVFVMAHGELGGAERQALLLGRRLASDYGAQVEFWSPPILQEGLAVRSAREQGIPWRFVNLGLTRQPYLQTFSYLSAAVKLAWRIRWAKTDIIFAYLLESNVACGLAWRWSGARLFIWNQRNGAHQGQRPRLEPVALRWTPRFISNSSHAAEFLSKGLGVAPEKVSVVRNGIELAPPREGRAQWRERLGAGKECFVACMIANFYGGKDHATLLRAWRVVVDELGKEGRQAVLALAGAFSKTHLAAKALAFDLGLRGHAKFLGQVTDVPGLLAASDLAVLTNKYEDWEGVPNGILEAMAAGLAVAGSDAWGIREAVGPENFKYLAPIGDARALADRILELVRDPELRATLGQANRRRVEGEFSVAQLCEKVAAIIADAI
ncbi:MAG: glycosyltransferase [Elusimicrobia bacterium]|nr:glycosyltransferase [Elusimicrobiota bacterium]